MMPIKSQFGNRILGGTNSPFVIAEMACAHDGSFDKAKALIEASVKANADAVQLQFFVPDETVTPSHEAYTILCDIAFSDAQWKELFDFGKQKGIQVFVCTYDVPSVKLAASLGADGIKLNSSDLSNPEVLIEVAKSGIPLTLGTGASTMEEIARGIATLEENGAENIILMHGVQNFPTGIDDLNISRINLLRSVFPDYEVGYADHTEGGSEFSLKADLVAIGLGASVLEKHITLDRSEKGIDYQAALEPKEFEHYVNDVQMAFRAFGTSKIKDFSASDLKYRKFQKKSIVANRDLSEGSVLHRTDVKFVRNENPGLPPIEFSKIEGKILNSDIKENQNIILSIVKQ
ncbi:MAG TPA: hypothetical protein DCR48_04880 [Flavobacteriales bacterium]|nr:hypothetical protein [Flavobacteriales bacterium]